LLQKLKASAESSAVDISTLADKLGYTHHDVYCLVFHQYPLVQEGIVQTIKIPSKVGLFVHLTRSGSKVKSFKTYPFSRKVKD
jgi:hypothetical protein